MNKLLHHRISPIAYWLLLVTLLAVTGCNKRQAIASYLVEEAAKPSPALSDLSAPAPYQPPLYQVTRQRSPFMATPYSAEFANPEATQPEAISELMAQPDCEPTDVRQATDISTKWSLRATFHDGHQTTALIHIPSIGIHTATLGQRLALPPQSDKKLNKAPEDRIEITAISSQQVSLKHQRIYSPQCAQTQVVTLNLYD